jgi:hypothetical protein
VFYSLHQNSVFLQASNFKPQSCAELNPISHAAPYNSVVKEF